MQISHLISKTGTNSCLWQYSLCLLWVRECQHLLFLRAYPAGRGDLELQGSQEVRWLPVVYQRRKMSIKILQDYFIEKARSIFM